MKIAASSAPPPTEPSKPFALGCSIRVRAAPFEHGSRWWSARASSAQMPLPRCHRAARLLGECFPWASVNTTWFGAPLCSVLVDRSLHGPQASLGVSFGAAGREALNDPQRSLSP
jgi:hypothetical protein